MEFVYSSHDHQNLLMDYEIFYDLDITILRQLFQHCSWLAFMKNHFQSGCVIYEGQIIPTMTMSSDRAMGIVTSKSLKLGQFMQKHRRDLKKWLYVSKDLCNIYQIHAKYFMDCCFVNEGYNDILQLSNIHEIRCLDEIVKILR